MEAATINNMPIVALKDSYGETTSSDGVPQAQRNESVIVPGKNNAVDNVKMPGSQKHLDKVVSNLNRVLESMDTSLQFYIHKDSGRVAVKVINNKTKEVIKEIPSEEVLRLAANMKEIAGLIIDTSI